MKKKSVFVIISIAALALTTVGCKKKTTAAKETTQKITTNKITTTVKNNTTSKVTTEKKTVIKQKFTVSFTGTAETIANQTIEEGSLISEPTKPEKEHYTFIGWFNGDNKWDFNKPVTSNLTLEARFEISKYTITYDLNGGSLDKSETKVTYNEEYTLDVPTKTGYTFKGWSYDEEKLTTESGESINNYELEENITVKAIWEINQYELNITNANSTLGSVSESGVYDYNTKVTITATPETGYAFVGWFDGENIISSKSSFEIAVTSNINLIAKFEAAKYTVTYDLNGGNLDKSKKEVVYNEAYILDVPTKTGYTFKGWMDSSENLVTDESGKSINVFNLTNDATFKASFEIINSYVTTSSNIAEAGTITETDKYDYGATVELVATVNDGYTFLGWYTDNKLATKELTCSFEMSDKAVSYEARYSINSYIISLNKGVGVLDDDSDIEVSFNGSYELPVPTRKNYDFLGWFNGNNRMTDEFGKSLVNYNIADDVTLKAVWYETEGLKFTAVSGGYEVSGKTASISGLKKIVVPEYYNDQPVIGIGKDGISVTDYIEEIVLPETVTYIGVQAFRNNSKLRSVKILGTVTAISNYAFSSCASLESIDLKEGLKTIGTGAFQGCSKLELTQTPTTVTSVGANAFYNCTSIKSFTLNTIYTGATMFSGCTNLKTLVISDNAIHTRNMLGGLTNLEEVTLKIYSTDESILFAHLFTTSTDSAVKYNGSNYAPSSLKTVHLSNTEKVHEYYFYGHTNITNFDIECVTEFAANSFNNSGITSLTINEGYKFGANSFSNSKLIDIYVNTDTYSISTGVFENAGSNSRLTIHVGENVTNIKGFASSKTTDVVYADNCVLKTFDGSAFTNCLTLKSIIVPESVQTIGTTAFNGCKNLLLVINLSELDITLGATTHGYVAYNALKVSNDINAKVTSVEVNDMTFVYNESTEEAYIYSYNGEGNPVFPESVDFGNGIVVTKYGIGREAFMFNTSITELIIPDNVTSIGEKAFYFDYLHVSNITKLSIGSGVTSIGTNAFMDLYKLDEFYFNANITSDLHGGQASKAEFYDIGNENTILTIGKDVKSLPANLFSYINRTSSASTVSIKELLFEEGSICTSIGAYSFLNMTKLTYVELPSTLTSIGTNAFYLCSNLNQVYNNSSLTITAGTSSNGYVAQYAAIVYKTGDTRMSIAEDTAGNIYMYDIEKEKLVLFKVNQSSSTFTFSESYTFGDHEFTNIEIGTDAFANNSKITNIVFTKAVTSIGINAFKFDSKSAVAINISGDLSGIKEIGERAFYNRQALTSFEFTNVEVIGGYAFYNCSGLIEVVIPNTTTSVGIYAFYGCSSVTSLTIGENVVTIKQKAFAEMTSLTNLYYNTNKVTTILYTTTEKASTSYTSGSNIFANAGKDATLIVTFGDKVTSIPNYFACGGANNGEGMYITNVVYSGNVTKIGTYAFSRCKLTSIVIPKSVTSLGKGAFYYCSSATSITIGTGITAISDEAFYECSKVTDVTFGGNEKSIGMNAFYHCISLTEITLPSGLTSISNYAFYYCTKLKSITIPENVSTLGSSVFRNCSSLDSFTFEGTKITTIPAYTFELTAIKDLVIPSCITTINNYAFNNCSGLKTITINSNVSTIQASAFSNCPNVTLINYNATNCGSASGAFEGCGTASGLKVVIGDNVTAIPQKTFYSATASNLVINEMVIGSKVSNYAAYMLYNVKADGIIVIRSTGKVVISSNCRSASNPFTGKVYTMTSDITDDYGALTSATNYIYSETPSLAGNYWHYDSEGNIVEEVISE